MKFPLHVVHSFGSLVGTDLLVLVLESGALTLA